MNEELHMERQRFTLLLISRVLREKAERSFTRALYYEEITPWRTTYVEMALDDAAIFENMAHSIERTVSQSALVLTLGAYADNRDNNPLPVRNAPQL